MNTTHGILISVKHHPAGVLIEITASCDNECYYSFSGHCPPFDGLEDGVQIAGYVVKEWLNTEKPHVTQRYLDYLRTGIKRPEK
jgi:hypothetical protein